MLFGTQHACTRSWIDAGAQLAAVIGHSFGELTALCVSQTLSLEDALKLIITHARLVRDAWSQEKGAVMAVEANLSDLNRLLAQSADACADGETPATIACYNRSRSFTPAGSSQAIDTVSKIVTKSFSLRSKCLDVTNAFHCSLADPILERLALEVESLSFREPVMPMNRTTERPPYDKSSTKFVVEHIRSPVFFDHALRHLHTLYPSCIFLEAGSNSTITAMASRALGNPSDSLFQGLNITSDKAWDSLVDVTLNLWKAGLSMHFWAHQNSQTKEQSPPLLPPYQYEEFPSLDRTEAAPKAIIGGVEQKAESEKTKLPETLLTFVGYQDSKKRIAKFRISTMIANYDRLVEDHTIAQTASICPATVQLDLVIEAIRGIRPDLGTSKLEPQLRGVENHSPIWVYPLASGMDRTNEKTQSGKMLCTIGKIAFYSVDDPSLGLEFARFERLIGHERCVDMLNSGDVDRILQQRNI
jgi:acyl transferase domain-containing protein